MNGRQPGRVPTTIGFAPACAPDATEEGRLLARLRDELARVASDREASARAGVAPAWPPSEPSPGSVSLERAERELCRVHHLELSRAARRAITLRARAAAPELVQAFQRRLTRAIRDARRADVRVPVELEALTRGLPPSWPAVDVLAAAARTLDPCAPDSSVRAPPE